MLPVVLHHHEPWDGSGYPDGLAGEQIPLLARIVAVADAFDAMRSDRPYRQGMPDEKLDAIIRAGAGKQWDCARGGRLLPRPGRHPLDFAAPVERRLVRSAALSVGPTPSPSGRGLG